MADFPNIPQDPLPVFDEATEEAMASAPPRKGFSDLLAKKYPEPLKPAQEAKPKRTSASAIWHLEQQAIEVQTRNPFDGYATGIVTGLQMARRAAEEFEQ